MRWRKTNRPRLASRFLEQQTDLFSALLRLAFLVAFLGTTVFSPAPAPVRQDWLIRLIVILACLYTTVVFLSYGGRRPLHWQRAVSLPLDLALISGALYSTNQQYWGALFQVYYLIVLEGAIWFRVPGAVLTALGAIIGYAVVLLASLYPTTTISEFLIQDYTGLPFLGIPFLIIVAIVAGYLVQSREEEQRQAAHMRSEMLLARTLQDAMLPPQPPEIPGWRVALRLAPAREVGGDLYLLERLADGRYLVCLGDIAGKSIYGLIYLSLMISQIRSAAREGLSPEAIASEVNRRVFDTLAPETYAALFIGLLDPATGGLSFVNCGHPPPLLLSPERGCLGTLASGGIVIGATRAPEYAPRAVTIGEGELLIAYTDGLSEARNAHGEEFQETRIANTALAAVKDGGKAEEVAKRLLDAARGWSADPGHDDATCLVLQRLAATED